MAVGKRRVAEFDLHAVSFDLFALTYELALQAQACICLQRYEGETLFLSLPSHVLHGTGAHMLARFTAARPCHSFTPIKHPLLPLYNGFCTRTASAKGPQ